MLAFGIKRFLCSGPLSLQALPAAAAACPTAGCSAHPSLQVATT